MERDPRSGAPRGRADARGGGRDGRSGGMGTHTRTGPAQRCRSPLRGGLRRVRAHRHRHPRRVDHSRRPDRQARSVSSQRLLAAEAGFAITTTVAMAVMSVASLLWWQTVAGAAPGFFAGGRVGGTDGGRGHADGRGEPRGAPQARRGRYENSDAHDRGRRPASARPRGRDGDCRPSVDAAPGGSGRAPR